MMLDGDDETLSRRSTAFRTLDSGNRRLSPNDGGCMVADNIWSAPDVVPSLAYEDVPSAAEWLTRTFGFRERSDARLSWAGGSMTWMEVGAGLINLSTAGGHELRSPRSVGAVSHALKVYVDDVDAHFKRAKAAGASIISELEDGFWGGRIYRARDLEGHHWEFAQRDKDLASTDWRLPAGVSRRER
jgi:uncharacterized glyoxalase superfamily protein PhnB